MDFNIKLSLSFFKGAEIMRRRSRFRVKNFQVVNTMDTRAGVLFYKKM